MSRLCRASSEGQAVPLLLLLGCAECWAPTCGRLLLRKALVVGPTADLQTFQPCLLPSASRLLLEVAPGAPPQGPAPAQEPAMAQEPAPAPVLAPSVGSATKECCICFKDFPLFQLRVLVPCGHNPGCEACSQQLVQRLEPCPICQAEVGFGWLGGYMAGALEREWMHEDHPP